MRKTHHYLQVFGSIKMFLCIEHGCIVIICKTQTPVVHLPNIHSTTNQQMKQVAGGLGGNTLVRNEMLRYSWMGKKWDEPFNICFKRQKLTRGPSMFSKSVFWCWKDGSDLCLLIHHTIARRWHDPNKSFHVLTLHLKLLLKAGDNEERKMGLWGSIFASTWGVFMWQKWEGKEGNFAGWLAGVLTCFY